MSSWLVVRFPNGSWSYGGNETDRDYEECEKFRVDALTAKQAIKKAQARRSREKAKGSRFYAVEVRP